MRERMAKLFALALTALIVGLAVLFASRQNAGGPVVMAEPAATEPAVAAPATEPAVAAPATPPAVAVPDTTLAVAAPDTTLAVAAPDTTLAVAVPDTTLAVAAPDTTLARGRAVYEEQGCARCHRLEGRGNPRSPLDGVGGRLTPERIRAFIVGDDLVRGALPASVVRTKEAYRGLSAQDLEALVAYLTTRRAPEEF